LKQQRNGQWRQGAEGRPVTATGGSDVGGAGRDGIFVLTFLTLILVTVVGAHRMVWLAFAHTLTDLPASGAAALKWFFVVVLAGAFSLIPVSALFIVLAMFTAGVDLWPYR
jgi:hypothetical protein